MSPWAQLNPMTSFRDIGGQSWINGYFRHDQLPLVMKGKHNKQSRNTSGSKITEEKPKSEPTDSDDEKSFSNWLRSEEGVENLKLFILGNTLVVFLVMAWPNIKETLDAIYYLYIQYTQNK